MKYVLGLFLCMGFYCNSNAQDTVAIEGTIELISNPCKDAVCIPGLVWTIHNDTTSFILTENGMVKWSDNPFTYQDDMQFSEGSIGIIEGVIKKTKDINDNIYYEFEVIGASNIINQDLNNIQISIKQNTLIINKNNTIQNASLYVYQLDGKLLFQNNIYNNQYELPLNNGEFIIAIKNDDFYLVKKFITKIQ